jgi:peptide/nickel transport system substrate-binding protein
MKFGLTAFAAIAAIGLASTPAKSETFKWAFQGDVQTMDPHGLFETMTLGFQRNIYEGLVIRNEKMEMVGASLRVIKTLSQLCGVLIFVKA